MTALRATVSDRVWLALAVSTVHAFERSQRIKTSIRGIQTNYGQPSVVNHR